MKFFKKTSSYLVLLISGMMLIALSSCGGDEEGGSVNGDPISEGVNIISFARTSDGTETRSITTDDSANVKIRLLSSSNLTISYSVFP